MKLLAQVFTAALCQHVTPDLSGARVGILTRGPHEPPEQQEQGGRGGKKQAAAQGLADAPGEGAVAFCACPSGPAKLADVGGERLPVLVPCGCHADPQAVFADVVFDFTGLEL